MPHEWKTVIELRKVSKYYDLKGNIIKAVDNVNLKVERQEYVSVIGRSGSGKTTLLSLIAGLTKPTSGKVHIGGIDIGTMDDKEQSILRAKKIGFIFQFSSLFPTLTVVENVMLPAIFDKTKSMVYDRAVELLEEVGLGDRIDAYASRLSVGQQKRVALCRALINNPEIILADEPTSDLDEATEKEIMQLLHKTHNDGATLIMVTHSKQIARHASRLLRMSNGIVTEV